MNISFKIIRFKYLFVCIFTSFVICCILSLIYLPSGKVEECNCSTESPKSKYPVSQHQLGIIVPFRDRFEELLEFAPHIHDFVAVQNIEHKIYVINQVDQYRFNRASLINIGFLVATSDGCDYIAMHDVDLLPLNPQLSYHYPPAGLFHVASPEYHPRYHYDNFVGGILIIKKEDFIRVNGMSNKYWGWGLEDDEFFYRLKEAGINITRPSNLTTGIQHTFRHIHDRVWRKRDMSKCYNQREVTRRRDRQTGLKNVKYTIQSRKSVIIERAVVSVINVALECNRTVTPWCLCSEERKKVDAKPPQPKKPTISNKERWLTVKQKSSKDHRNFKMVPS